MVRLGLAQARLECCDSAGSVTAGEGWPSAGLCLKCLSLHGGRRRKWCLSDVQQRLRGCGSHAVLQMGIEVLPFGLQMWKPQQRQPAESPHADPQHRTPPGVDSLQPEGIRKEEGVS